MLCQIFYRSPLINFNVLKPVQILHPSFVILNYPMSTWAVRAVAYDDSTNLSNQFDTERCKKDNRLSWVTESVRMKVCLLKGNLPSYHQAKRLWHRRWWSATLRVSYSLPGFPGQSLHLIWAPLKYNSFLQPLTISGRTRIAPLASNSLWLPLFGQTDASTCTTKRGGSIWTYRRNIFFWSCALLMTLQ